jgi:hypothetical protein
MLHKEAIFHRDFKHSNENLFLYHKVNTEGNNLLAKQIWINAETRKSELAGNYFA